MKKYGFFKKLICLGMIFSLTFIGLSGCGQKKTELVNVSYDATREFYKEYNRLLRITGMAGLVRRLRLSSLMAVLESRHLRLLMVLGLMLSRLLLREMLML